MSASMHAQLKIIHKDLTFLWGRFSHHMHSRYARCSQDSFQDVKDEFPYMPIFGFEDLEKVTGGRMNDVVETEARREYCRYYRDEIELNKHFNTFVLNYQLAYQGPNTLKAQIGAGLKRFAQIRKYKKSTFY